MQADYQPIVLKEDGPTMSESVDTFRLQARPPHNFLFATDPKSSSLIDVSLDRKCSLRYYPNSGCECPSCIQFFKMNFLHSGFERCDIIDKLLRSAFEDLIPYAQCLTWCYTKEDNINMGVMQLVVTGTESSVLLPHGFRVRTGTILGQCVVNFNDTFLLNCVYLAMLSAFETVDNFRLHFAPHTQFEAQKHLARFVHTLKFLFQYSVDGITWSVVPTTSGSGLGDHHRGYSPYSYNVIFDYACTTEPLYGHNAKALPLKKSQIQELFAMKLISGGFDFNKKNCDNLQI